MEYPSWQQARTRRIGYARRSPEETPLYRVIYHCRDDFEYRWGELFEHRYGALRREVLAALDRYLSCGILAHGCARARCEQCNHSILIAFSCKRRGLCVSCDTKRALLFAEQLYGNVLYPYPQRHWVFSIPKRLRVYFKFDRKLTALLYQAAWEALRASVVPSGLDDTTPAAVMALHTAGDLLNFHPHIHALVLDGTIDQYGKFSQLPAPDTEQIAAAFGSNVFNALLKRDLLTEDTIINMASWPHSGFHVFSGSPISYSDRDKLLFVSQYLKKPPLSLRRLELLEDGTEPVVRYYKTYDNPEIYRDFSPLEFLAELQQHIPDTWEQTTRYYGAYSCRTRGIMKRDGFIPSVDRTSAHLFIDSSRSDRFPDEPIRPKASPTWAAMIKRVYEVDPLTCPRCAQPMKIIAFLTNTSEINKICDNLGLPSWRAPPPWQAAKTTTGPTVVPLFDHIQFEHLH